MIFFARINNTKLRTLRILFTIFFFTMLMNVDAVSQDTIGLAKKKSETLQILRAFRDSLRNKPGDIALLRENTAQLVGVAKLLEDTSELNLLKEYFLQATEYFSNVHDVKEVNRTLLNISNDLEMKIKAGDNSLQLGSTFYFGKQHDVKVTAYINGNKQVGGTYRLYWGTFLGNNQESMVRANKFDGSSNLFSNPYTLTIKLPGYITFWMEDATTKKVYRSDVPFKIMTEKDLKLDLNFIELK